MKVPQNERVLEVSPQESIILYNDNASSRDVIVDWLEGEWIDKRCEIPPKGTGVVFNNTQKKKVLHLPEGVMVTTRTEKSATPTPAIPRLTHSSKGNVGIRQST